MKLNRLKISVFISILFHTFGVTSALSGPTESEVWQNLHSEIEHGKLGTQDNYIGKKIQFEGIVIDPFVDKEKWLRPNPLRIKVLKNKTDKLGIICNVTLRPEEVKSVAGFGAAQIVVLVKGVVTKIDQEKREVFVQSERAEVTASD